MAERFGYLVSQYPTLSHSFIFREIAELRNLGFDILVASVRTPDRAWSALSPEERTEADAAYYVRAHARHWPGAHLRMLLSAPAAYFAGLMLALRSAKWDLTQAARHLRFFAEAIAVGDWARRHNLRRLHTHFSSLTAMLVGRVFGLAISMTIHGSDEFIDPEGFCMREKLDAASLAVGISRYGASQIMRFSNPRDWDKVRVVRLGINPDEFQSRISAPANATYEIVTVGRMAPVKAYRFLLCACQIAAARGLQFHLTLIGGGPDQAPLQNFAAELGLSSLVTFTGALPNHEVRARVVKADCFALSSFAEGVPVVLMEAMALGVPCVATRVTGVPELIEHGQEGLLVPPGDADQLAGALLTLANDPALRQRFALNGRNKIVAQYDLRKNARELADLLRNVRS